MKRTFAAALPPAVLTVGGAALLFSLRDRPELALLVGFLILPGIFLLALDQPLLDRARLGLGLPVVLASFLALTALTALILDLDFVALLGWYASPMLFAAAGFALGALSGLRRAGQLLALALPVLVLFAPFLADAWLVTAKAAELQRSVSNGLVELSAWPAACADLLDVDLYKNEQIYREFRIAEQLYAFPDIARSLRSQGLLALAVLMGAGVVLSALRLSARLLSHNR